MFFSSLSLSILFLSLFVSYLYESWFNVSFPLDQSISIHSIPDCSLDPNSWTLAHFVCVDNQTRTNRERHTLIQRVLGGKQNRLNELDGKREFVPRFGLFGTYIPSLFFGLRFRRPGSPYFGVLHYDADDLNAIASLRPNGDVGGGAWGWTKHWGEGGRQDGRVKVKWMKVENEYANSFAQK